MSDVQYRATIVYEVLRPYFPPHYAWAPKNQPSVGTIGTVIVGPYARVSTVKAGITRAKQEHPLRNHYGDGLDSVKIVDIIWEKSTIKWEPHTI